MTDPNQRLEDDMLMAARLADEENIYSLHGGDPRFSEKLNDGDLLLKTVPEYNVVDYEKSRKRKRVEEENYQRQVMRKIDEERKSIQSKIEKNDKTCQDLYQLFTDLQGMTLDFGLNFQTPEIVVVGMQSDGKSSFIEGLLGFQFNIVETNIGTRRPLILQMINDSARDKPYCRFRKEVVTNEGEDQYEDRDIPVDFLSMEIVRRTENVCGLSQDRVSPKPIILRVEYKYCSNLTIYDTPGFRIGGDERLTREIEYMVREIMKLEHRILVCLEQSTVEWANTISRPLVKSVDPNFSRTILVNTKFDNRVKELRDPISAAKYLTGEGLPPDKKPYFISMPVRRNLEPRHFKDAIVDCYISDYQSLLSIKFDEERFGGQVGFFKLKSYLEKVLHQKYKESIAPTLQTLESLCYDTNTELVAAQNEIKHTDIEDQKSKVNCFIGSFVLLIERLLEGSVIGDPDTYGLTLTEERIESGVATWGNSDIDFSFQNAELKLYGGAQYERLLNEFEYVAHSIEFPVTSINEVASALGTSKSHNAPSFEAAASDIVQTKSKKVLLPLIHKVLHRCSFIMVHLFKIAMKVMVLEEPNVGILGRYDQFSEELQKIYVRFVHRTRDLCEAKSLDDFTAFTKILDFELMSGLSEVTDYDYLNCSKEETKKRVEAIMGINRPQLMRQETRSRVIDEDSYQYVLMMGGKLFAGVRYFFTKYIRSKFNAFFLEPMFQQLGRELTDHFRKMSNERYEELFNLGLTQLQQRVKTLQIQLDKLTAQRERFRDVLAKFKRLADLV